MPEGIWLGDSTSLGNDTLLDLLKTTQADMPWDGQFETLQKYHQYPICNTWFTRDKVTQDGGAGIIRNVQLTETGTARFVLPWEPTAVSASDVQGRLRIDYTKLQDSYSISRDEMLRSRGKGKLIDLEKTRRMTMLMNMANKIEVAAWTAPTSAANAQRVPYGIPYWLIKPTADQTTADTEGHFGGNPTGFSDCGGIDCTQTEPDASRWKSYIASWEAAGGGITDADILKLTQMLRRLHFKAPIFVKDQKDSSLRTLSIYCGETTLNNLEDRARKNNDSLGADVAKYAGATLIKNIPLEWNEQLDSDTTYPLYAVNHDYFHPVVLQGDYFRTEGPMNDRSLPDVFTTFDNLTFNFLCINRRTAGGCIAYST